MYTLPGMRASKARARGHKCAYRMPHLGKEIGHCNGHAACCGISSLLRRQQHASYGRDYGPWQLK